MKLWRRLPRPRAERVLDGELRSYIEHDIDARTKNGIDPGEARRAALADFGGVEQVKELIREQRSGALFDNLVLDFRYSLRAVAKSPTFACSVIGSLAAGIAVAI